MIRLIRRLALVGLVLTVLVIVLGYMAMDIIAAWMVQRTGHRATGVPTYVMKANVRPLAGRLTLCELRVANPEGFRGEYFFTVDQAEVEIKLNSVMNERIDLTRLKLAGLRLNLERDDLGRSNHAPIFEHLHKITQRGENTGLGHRYLIRELILEDITIILDVPLPFGGRLPLTFEPADIHLTDIGADDADERRGGVLLSQLAEFVAATVIGSVAPERAENPSIDFFGSLLGEIQPSLQLR